MQEPLDDDTELDNSQWFIDEFNSTGRQFYTVIEAIDP
jgi:hypothetical protein